MWRSRLFWRMFGIYGIVLAAAIAAIGLAVSARVESRSRSAIEATLQTDVLLVQEVMRGQKLDVAELQRLVARLRSETGTRITLIDREGHVLADSEKKPDEMDNHGTRPEILESMHQRFGSASRLSDTLKEPMLYVALHGDDTSATVRFVRVALPLTAVQAQLGEIRHVIWTIALLTGVAAMLAAFFVARRIARPIQELTDGAANIAAGKYGKSVFAVGTDEIGALGRAFNYMSEQLREQFTQVEADRQQLHAILSGMVEGVIALDASQRILFVNNRAATFLEFDAQAAIGRLLWEVLRVPALEDLVRRALQSEEPCREQLQRSGPPSRSLLVHAARLTGAAASGAVLVIHDISDLRRLERVRQDFVANVSHELKTPLSVIQACVETLLDGAVDDPENRDTFLEQVRDQSERLKALILDLLSLARIEGGTETYEHRPVSMAEVAAACVDRHRARAESKHHILETACASGSDTTVVAWADEEAVGQILDNLVDNALKYTQDGGRICVRYGTVGDQVFLEVEDNGIGIAERDLQRIFERFYRVDKARSREMGGTGLGLSIVKHLAQALHGSATAVSRLGHGSRFIVHLPVYWQAPSRAI